MDGERIPRILDFIEILACNVYRRLSDPSGGFFLVIEIEILRATDSAIFSEFPLHYSAVESRGLVNVCTESVSLRTSVRYSRRPAVDEFPKREPRRVNQLAF